MASKRSKHGKFNTDSRKELDQMVNTLVEMQGMLTFQIPQKEEKCCICLLLLLKEDLLLLLVSPLFEEKIIVSYGMESTTKQIPAVEQHTMDIQM